MSHKIENQSLPRCSQEMPHNSVKKVEQKQSHEESDAPGRVPFSEVHAVQMEQRAAEE